VIPAICRFILDFTQSPINKFIVNLKYLVLVLFFGCSVQARHLKE